ncbi:MAG: NifB/NifX family molybdenum-iron cluster-binding protein [Intestinibacter bartlettii]|uniref:NifB/NifX family molybdenum-iron cluster-binding protein n=1 Tax=Intestinibacter bartlettii TaxID=261299 RepID=UPI0026EF4E24|nr:NifB/NifX family molybdenum-iron cluster-binding protein [Intestinibacter bartlettii]MDO5011636.1 NifB/NifX family molybdenum-iron cluster-binding protein [Intestinibacter bartlettii]
MKVCIPVEENKGMESVPYGHFGSAPEFVICDLDSKEIKSINNGDLGHEHGKCQPLKALKGQEVDAIIVGGIGAGAITKLNAMGTKVYRGVKDTIEYNLSLLKNNQLQELSVNDACSHNHGDGGCGHDHGHNINL